METSYTMYAVKRESEEVVEIAQVGDFDLLYRILQSLNSESKYISRFYITKTENSLTFPVASRDIDFCKEDESGISKQIKHHRR